jgi:hypothetical protein
VGGCRRWQGLYPCSESQRSDRAGPLTRRAGPLPFFAFKPGQGVQRVL